jgi:hypothetical protein
LGGVLRCLADSESPSQKKKDLYFFIFGKRALAFVSKDPEVPPSDCAAA